MRGRHLGALDALTGQLVKDALKDDASMSADPKRTFLELCAAGRAAPAEIDDYVDRWHDEASDQALHEYLGMTREEYAAWVKDASSLVGILAARAQQGARRTSVSATYKAAKKRPASVLKRAASLDQGGKRPPATRRTVKALGD